MSEEIVPIRYYQTIPKRVNVGGEVYIFSVRNNISLCWIKKEYVDTVLSMTKTCCGGQKKSRIFRIANETEIRRHQFGGR
ncbi:hypothetical protein KA005_58450 [bacterium]|nr:hypothetical protein [bacterium]